MRTALASGAILAAVLAPAPARAKVVSLPPPVGGCTQGATWDAVAECLAKARYTQKPLRQGTDWKLLELESQRHPAVKPEHFQAERLLALYVNNDPGRSWVLSGHISVSGSHYELLGASKTKIHKHDVWKLDLGQAIPTHVATNDSGASVPALVRLNRTLYCSARSPYCTDVFTACEVLVRGRAWYTFRGTARLVDGDTAVEIIGDRSRAGRNCPIEERVTLQR